MKWQSIVGVCVSVPVSVSVQVTYCEGWGGGVTRQFFSSNLMLIILQ